MHSSVETTSEESLSNFACFAFNSNNLRHYAKEMNLSETAFVMPRSSDAADAAGVGRFESAEFNLRWFTPSGTEVDLCGKAFPYHLVVPNSAY